MTGSIPVPEINLGMLRPEDFSAARATWAEAIAEMDDAEIAVIVQAVEAARVDYQSHKKARKLVMSIIRAVGSAASAAAKLA